MNVIVFSRRTVLHGIGGFERHLCDFAEGLAARGHTVDVITTEKPDKTAGEEIVNNVTYHFLEHTVPGKYSQSYWILSTKVAEEIGGDILWSQGAGGLGYIKKLRRKMSSPPLVTFVHGYGFLDPVLHTVSLFRLPKKDTNTIGVTPEHVRISLLSGIRKMAFVYMNTQTLLSRSNSVIAINRKASQIIRFCHFISGKKIHIVRLGVDSSRFKPKINTTGLKFKLGIDEESKVIFSAGRFSAGKGFQYLLYAFKRLRKAGNDAYLVIAGDGPYRSYLENLSRRLRLENRTIFVGAIHDKLPEYYNLCDLFVCPTVMFEGSPYVVLEAMSCGKPVIASRIGGICEQINDMVDGILIPPGDAFSIFKNIHLILEDQPDLALEIGARAREKVLNEFNLQDRVRDVEEIFERLVE